VTLGGNSGRWHAVSMDAAVHVVYELVNGIRPWDHLETEHRAETLHWLEITNDVFRRAKPATPDRHLVSYVVMVDPDDGSSLLVDHINAGLWLPPGGHVEPGEHPTETARRETHEELGVDPIFAEPNCSPSFLTVTRTGGLDSGHIDVSVWFLLVGRRGMDLSIDQTEFNEARWWSQGEIRAANPKRFDPHYARFIAKVSREQHGAI
jgi:8-oxo-dGTP diphosphatase